MGHLNNQIIPLVLRIVEDVAYFGNNVKADVVSCNQVLVNINRARIAHGEGPIYHRTTQGTPYPGKPSQTLWKLVKSALRLEAYCNSCILRVSMISVAASGGNNWYRTSWATIGGENLQSVSACDSFKGHVSVPL